MRYLDLEHNTCLSVYPPTTHALLYIFFTLELRSSDAPPNLIHIKVYLEPRLHQLQCQH